MVLCRKREKRENMPPLGGVWGVGRGGVENGRPCVVGLAGLEMMEMRDGLWLRGAGW